MTLLSDRLMAVAKMVTPGHKVADIGCDHAYLSIYLVSNNVSPFVIACDVNRGPLEKAKQNISARELDSKIELRLCNGLAGLKKGEVSSVVIAGMGGKLMADILDKGADILEDVKEIILEPQSEVSALRHYLEDHGYHIISEDMIYEDDKYYPIIKAVHGNMCLSDEIFFRYGKILIREENPVLHQFLIEERTFFGRLINELSDNSASSKAAERLKEVRRDLAMCEKALTMISETGIFEGDRVID